MSWFKVDDTSAFNAKVMAAGNEAWGAFCRVGAWCAQQLSDGRFSRAIALTIAPMRVWEKLSAVGLVDRLENGEMQMHDYLDRNPSREQVMAEREFARRRVNRFRSGLNDEIFKRDQFTCQYCGSKKGPLAIDHIVPVVRGGKDDESNLVTACRACNSKKKDRLPEECGMRLLRVTATVTHALLPVGSGSDLDPESESKEDPVTAREPEAYSQTLDVAPNVVLHTSSTMCEKIWAAAWEAKYSRPYVWLANTGLNGDVRQLHDIWQMAMQQGPTTEPIFRHWVRCYLRDSDPYVADKGHPVWGLKQRVNAYGLPSQAKPRAPRVVEPEAPPAPASTVAEILKGAGFGKKGTAA